MYLKVVKSSWNHTGVNMLIEMIFKKYSAPLCLVYVSSIFSNEVIPRAKGIKFGPIEFFLPRIRLRNGWVLIYN